MRQILFLLVVILSVGASVSFAEAPTTLHSQRVYCGGAQAEVKYASISAAGGGDTTVVAAVSGKKIRVIGYSVTSDTANGLLRFESDTGGTALTGVMTFGDNFSLSVNCAPFGCFETVAGELLNAEAATASFTGHLTYIECS